jgi:hypothetical protein
MYVCNVCNICVVYVYKMKTNWRTDSPWWDCFFEENIENILQHVSWDIRLSTYTPPSSRVMYFSAALFNRLYSVLLSVLNEHGAEQGPVVIEWPYNAQTTYAV